MATLQNEFIQFHEAIKLEAYEESSSLRDKRDLLVTELTAALKRQSLPNKVVQ